MSSNSSTTNTITTPTTSNSVNNSNNKRVVTVVQGNVVTPKGVLFGGFIEIVGDTIVAVEPSTTPQPQSNNEQDVTVASSPWVIPGFVDIHNHGLGGCEEVCDHWLFPEFTQKKLASWTLHHQVQQQ